MDDIEYKDIDREFLNSAGEPFDPQPEVPYVGIDLANSNKLTISLDVDTSEAVKKLEAMKAFVAEWECLDFTTAEYVDQKYNELVEKIHEFFASKVQEELDKLGALCQLNHDAILVAADAISGLWERVEEFESRVDLRKGEES